MKILVNFHLVILRYPYKDKPELQRYIQSFVDFGPPAIEKNIFERYLPYMGMAAILVM